MSLLCCYVRLVVHASHASEPSGVSAAVVQGWITAVGTVALALLALATAILAGLAYRKQSGEVGILVEQNERDVAERRIAQAARVFIGVPRVSPTFLVRPYAKNASDLPVFDVQSWYLRLSGLAGPDNLGVILPGEQPDAGPPRSATEALESTILTFRDAKNVRWIRMPDGVLEEQSRDTVRESVLAASGLPSPEPTRGS